MRALSSIRHALTWLTAVFVFLFSWLFRFNDPGGSFAGLTDDHFFYLTRGWQILFGDLPVRDFVDHGAPLYYYMGAAVQVVLGRGTLSELAFSVTMLALAAALTFWLAARASGSILLGVLGAAVQVFLAPRLYNYPKVLVYAVAIPVLWWFADRPSGSRTFWIALVTVIAFLFRHDHGVFVAVAMGVVLLMATETSFRERVSYALIYGSLVLVLLAPYLIYIERNGGIGSYFRQAAQWAEKDRARAPVVWPGVFDNPDGVSDAARDGAGLGRARAVLEDNSVAWFFYAELLLPFFALFLLAVSTDAFRPSWPHAQAKLVMVAVLAVVLDAGFLRSPLAARLADPSVPLAILIAWLVVAVPKLLLSARSLRPSVQRYPVLALVRVATVLVATPLAVVVGLGTFKNFHERLDAAALAERPGLALERVEHVSAQLRKDWDLESWVSREDRPDLINLAFYVSACTAPTDRALVQPYIPQVLALARRAFAGGHADLRPGFFRTDEAERLTIQRLSSQPVPIIMLETGDAYENFRKSFPRVTAYIDERYRLAGTHVFDERFGINLFVRRDLTPNGSWEPLGWPCYGSGRVTS